MAPTPIENPTLVERFVSMIPLKYSVAALVWSIMLGGPVFFVIQFLETGAPEPSLGLFANIILNSLLPFYLFLIVRYVRLKVVGEEGQIVPRLSGGEEDYHRAFSRMTWTVPVVPLTIVLGALLLREDLLTGVLPTSPFLAAVNIVVVYLNSLAFSTYLWEFATASLGIYRLGSSSLKLGNFLEDRMMGVKPLGSLALSLTIAYYGGLLLAFLLLSTFLPSSLTTLTLFLVLVASGIVFFFLPLTSIHGRMQMEKQRLFRKLMDRYPGLRTVPVATQGATLDDVRSGLEKLTGLQELELLERKVSSLPTWPFDIQLLSRLITIILSVIAAFVARIIIDVLKV